MNHAHTLQDDFDHFIAYSGYWDLPEEEKARLYKAYEHGNDRGEG